MELKNESVENIPISAVIDTIQIYFENESGLLAEYLNREGIDEAVSVTKEMASKALQAFKVIKVLKAGYDISIKLFVLKLENYIEGLTEIPLEKRKAYLKKVGSKQFNNDTILVLNILNRIEEISKIQILVKIFEMKIEDKINDETFRRWMILVDKTLMSDLRVLKEQIKEGTFPLISVAEEGLLSSGWMIIAGTNMKSTGGFYKYTDTAKLFCQMIYNMKIPEGGIAEGTLVLETV